MINKPCLLKQTIRIIGGQFRGKKIAFPDQPDLRPTPDRVRETLFNWLMNDIRGANCLDAFAGSGALGLEAFSRGANQVILIEQSPVVYAHLKKTCQQFNTPQLTVIQDNSCHYMKQVIEQQHPPFDIIFVDPPFRKPDLLAECLSYLANPKLLKPQGLLYLETPEEMVLDTTLWTPLKLKSAGQITYALYTRNHATC